jgi:protoporphyrinogen IX oxidase
MTAGLYLWVKALHIIAIIAWMAGMLYLPRLFVYHREAAVGSVQSETFKVMERRLLRAIINPAMIASWVLGLWLAWSGNFLSAPWFHGKLVLVLAMSAIHGMLARDFAADRNRDDHRGAPVGGVPVQQARQGYRRRPEALDQVGDRGLQIDDAVLNMPRLPLLRKGRNGERDKVRRGPGPLLSVPA